MMNIISILTPIKGEVKQTLSGLFRLFFLLLLIAGGVSQAQAACSQANPQIVKIPLNPPTISAGADLPVGTIIYTGKYTLPNSTSNTCTDTNIMWNMSTISTPLPLSSWSGTPYGGRVFETGVPGIGLAFVNITNGHDYAIAPGYIDSIGPSNAGGTTTAYGSVQIYLIKTGAIPPGNYPLNISNLPTFKVYIDSASSKNVIMHNISMVGNFTVSAQTCTTPDVNVPMGTYPVAGTFTGVGSTTPWVETNFALKNCPVFFGYYNKSNIIDLNTGNLPVSNGNNLGVRLTPNTSIVGAVANGVMAIDPSAPASASGVGIQIGWGSSAGMPVPFNFSTEKILALAKTGGITIPIPLVARYIQTGSQVTAGRANGAATFTINYY